MYTAEEQLKIIANDCDLWNIPTEQDGRTLQEFERVQVLTESIYRITECITKDVIEGCHAALKKEFDRIIRRISKEKFGKQEEKTSAEK